MPRSHVLVAIALIAGTLSPPGMARAQDAGETPFAEWLAGVRAEALERGIRPETVERALGGLDAPLSVVLERDRSQAETVETLEAYIHRRVTARAVRTGRQMLERHRDVLAKVVEAYGVPAEIVVAIWGVESNFGRFTGIRPTIEALATLAWDRRRSAFFRGELFAALEILDRGDIDLESLRGSWAGAMGQPQFMPSSYLRFAQDFDGDGRRDIWKSPGDIFASIANYLRGHGWVAGRRWGREVHVGEAAEQQVQTGIAGRAGGCAARRDMTVALPLAQWDELGIRLPGGRRLPKAAQTASLVAGATRRFLVYGNYDALLDYNCAHAYALTVALLADRLRV